MAPPYDDMQGLDGTDPRPTGPARRRFDDDAIVGFARWVIRWRWAVIGLSLLAAAAAASGAPIAGLTFSSDYRVFFSAANPQLEAFERLQRVYTKDDNISFVLKPSSGEVFTPRLLDAIRGLTAAAWKIPYATRVDSIANYQHSFADGDDLTVRDLIGPSTALTPDAIARIREVALTEPLLVDGAISPDGTTTSVNVTLTLPMQSLEEMPAAMARARALAARFEIDYPDVRVAITGLVPLNTAFFEASQQDMSTLTPLMFGVLLLAIVLLLRWVSGSFRSIGGTFATLLVIAFSATTAMGLAAWFGIKLTPPSSVAPTVILTIAVADSIHLLVTMFAAMRRGMAKRDAIVESLRVNFGPVFLTSLTTVIGFLSLNFSDAPPFHDLGNITAMGVVAAWAYSILFLPAAMAVLPLAVAARPADRRAAMDRLADFVIARRRVLLFATTAVVLFLGAMVPRIELNDQFVQYFDPSIQFRADADFAMANLSGSYQMHWSLPAAGPGGIGDPAYLKGIEAFTKWLRGQPGVVHVRTLTDTFSRLNRNMHGDDPAWHRLPEQRDLAAQYLLLFEMSLPYGLDLNNQINVDKSAMRLIATTDNITSNELKAIDGRARDWLNGGSSLTPIQASGPIMMFAYITERNAKSMLLGTTVALLLISLSLTLALRSLRLGLVSLVPNLIPAVMAFGIWEILVDQVDVAASIVTATSLGIIVDATVHFLSKYQRARREGAETAEAAVRYAFSTVGVALLVSSAVLIAGFAILSFSAFRLNSNMGQLTAIAIAAALFADFLLLPALLLTVDRRRNRGAGDQSTGRAAVGSTAEVTP